MKTKPKELSTDIQAWREAEPEKVTTRADGRDARISKTVRMRLRFSEMLRDESYRRSVETGNKVSEADLIDEALAAWQLKNNIQGD